jgi:hypothetical protein
MTGSYTRTFRTKKASYARTLPTKQGSF